MTAYQNWLLAEDNHIATLTLNRPAENNSLTTDTLRELHAITAELGASDDVWAVILQGQGPHFSAGADIQLFETMLNASKKAFREVVLETQLVLDDFENIRKPTIARLQGFCIGGALFLALCCDFRIASQRTIFAFPEVKLGLNPLWGTHRITRLTGVAAAKELLMLGERFSAKTAHELGLVNRVVPPDQLDAEVAATADKFHRLPPRSVGMIKHLIHNGYHLPLRESEDMEIEMQAALLNSPDLREAVESYMEKSEPNFTGK